MEGDEATEAALDVELREEIEDEWFPLGDTVCTTRFHLPYLSDCSYSDTSSELSDVIMDAHIDELPEYVDGFSDYYAEDLLLSTVEQKQD